MCVKTCQEHVWKYVRKTCGGSWRVEEMRHQGEILHSSIFFQHLLFWWNSTVGYSKKISKTVLLYECKRHTAHCIASACSAVLSWGYPILTWQGSTQSWLGVPHLCPGQGVPHPDLAGGTPSWASQRVHHLVLARGVPQFWLGGTPSWPGQGYPILSWLGEVCAILTWWGVTLFWSTPCLGLGVTLPGTGVPPRKGPGTTHCRTPRRTWDQWKYYGMEMGYPPERIWDQWKYYGMEMGYPLWTDRHL